MLVAILRDNLFIVTREVQNDISFKLHCVPVGQLRD